MMPNKKIRQISSSIAFFILLYVIYRFYSYTAGGVQPEEIPSIIIMGILLVISIGVVSVIRYYYDSVDKNQTIKNKELDAELKAYSIMADGQKLATTDPAKQQDHLKN